MKADNLILVGGLAAVGIAAYFLFKKNGAAEQATDALTGFGQDIRQAGAPLWGTPSFDGSTGYPNLWDRLINDLNLVKNNAVADVGNLFNPQVQSPVLSAQPSFGLSTFKSTTLPRIIQYSQGNLLIGDNPSYSGGGSYMSYSLQKPSVGGLSLTQYLGSTMSQPLGSNPSNKLIVKDKPKKYITVNGKQVEVLN